MKNILLLLILQNLLYATTINLQYEGGISFFGKVGDANITLQTDIFKHHYFIKLTTQSIGVVKVLSANKRYIFSSEGSIENGRYIPKKFEEIVTKNNYIERTKYLFNYTTNKVTKITDRKELVTKNSYDIVQLKIVPTKKLKTFHKQDLIQLQNNDYLTLFLNFTAQKLIPGELHYIDQKDSNKLILINKNTFEVSKHNGKDIYKIYIQGNKKDFFTKAVATDIAFYGDAYIQKISEKRQTSCLKK